MEGKGSERNMPRGPGRFRHLYPRSVDAEAQQVCEQGLHRGRKGTVLHCCCTSLAGVYCCETLLNMGIRVKCLGISAEQMTVPLV